jgi:hypothetical protein
MNDNDNLSRSYRRWHAAERSGRDDEADAEFRTLFSAVVEQRAATVDFAARTMEAVAAAAARDARRARRARAGIMAAGVCSAVLLAYFGSGLFVGFGSGLVARTVDLLIALVVKMAGAAETGADVWSVLSSIGRTAAAVTTDPTVTVMLFALQAIALAALVALQRLLGADEESLK